MKKKLRMQVEIEYDDDGAFRLLLIDGPAFVASGGGETPGAALDALLKMKGDSDALVAERAEMLRPALPEMLTPERMAEVVHRHLAPSEVQEVLFVAFGHTERFVAMSSQMQKTFATEREVALALLHLARTVRSGGVA